MEEFFFKLGIMTQRNHEALIQELRALRTSIDALNEKLSELSATTTNSHATLAKELSELSATTTNNHSTLANRISALTMKTTNNYAMLDEGLSALTTQITNNHATLVKKFSTLVNQSTTDARAVKESLENVEELLRLTAVNQIMNLVEK